MKAHNWNCIAQLQQNITYQTVNHSSRTALDSLILISWKQPHLCKSATVTGCSTHWSHTHWIWSTYLDKHLCDHRATRVGRKHQGLHSHSCVLCFCCSSNVRQQLPQFMTTERRLSVGAPTRHIHATVNSTHTLSLSLYNAKKWNRLTLVLTCSVYLQMK